MVVTEVSQKAWEVEEEIGRYVAFSGVRICGVRICESYSGL